ncbi:MAG: hypothetical protein EBR81_12720, partial [Proteobacteria bacterium]|nr:hypothetical protein [Pseudomonadota bacterium]
MKDDAVGWDGVPNATQTPPRFEPVSKKEIPVLSENPSLRIPCPLDCDIDTGVLFRRYSRKLAAKLEGNRRGQTLFA